MNLPHTGAIQTTPVGLREAVPCPSPHAAFLHSWSTPSLAMLLPPQGYSPNAMAQPDVQRTAGKAITAFPRSTPLMSNKSIKSKEKEPTLLTEVSRASSPPSFLHHTQLLHMIQGSFISFISSWAILASSAKIWGRLEWVTTNTLINTHMSTACNTQLYVKLRKQKNTGFPITKLDTDS